MSALVQLYNAATSSGANDNNSNGEIKNNTNMNHNNNNNTGNESVVSGINNDISMPTCITPMIEGKMSPMLQARKSSDQSTIPSPPLSPYQRNAELISTKSTVPISLINSNLLFDNVSQPEPVVSVERRFSKGEFPLEELQNRSLSINAWNDLQKGNFKKNHLNFLSNYQIFRNNNSNLNYRVGKKYNTVPRTRRVVHNINSDFESLSDFEKIRTRRVARSELQSYSNTPVGTATAATTTAIATPSATPVIAKKPRRPRTETPASPANGAVFVDYESIPDFSPELSTLPNNNRCLKQEWKGQPMSLANDPLASKLHPAELMLASILRLPCSIYLDSKRRLFLEKVNRMKRGLPFRRTDAQKACKIDVNKASRLFAAFEKVGWLREEHFKRFL